MTDGLVSVIVPAFNAATDIAQTVRSVLAQTYQEIEVIVVDDGSRDATCAIVEEFAARDPRIQLVRQSNGGVGAARNTAIRQARGKYIAPLDADDFWYPDKLEKQVACMQRFGDETGLVYCWSDLVNEDGELLYTSPPFRFEGRLRHVLVLSNVLGNASVPLFRTAALEKVGLYLTRAEQGGAQGCEDWDLTLRVAESFSVRVVPEYLVAYRQNSAAMSVNTEGMAASFAVTMRRAQQRNSDLPTVTFRWSAGYFYIYLADKCHHWNHFSKCLHYLRQAIWANPVLLLKPGIYKTSVRSAFGIVIGSNGKPKKAVRLSRGKRRKHAVFLNKIFRHIEVVRWSAALEDGA
jgi:glycosyltransferase involved in cell wall biosynthesis